MGDERTRTQPHACACIQGRLSVGRESLTSPFDVLEVAYRPFPNWLGLSVALATGRPQYFISCSHSSRCGFTAGCIVVRAAPPDVTFTLAAARLDDGRWPFLPVGGDPELCSIVRVNY